MNLKDFYEKLSTKRAIDQVTDLANDPILTDIIQTYMKTFVSHIIKSMGRFYNANEILKNAEKALSSTDNEVMIKGSVAYLKEIYTQVDPRLVPNSLRVEALSYEIIMGYKEVAKMAPLTRDILGLSMSNDYAYFDTMPRVVISNTKDGKEKFQGYPSWSGIDMTVVAIMGSAMRFLPDLSTISFSIERDQVDIKPLGRATRSGVTKGTRIISGSLIGVALKDEPLRSIAPSALNQAAGNDQLQSAFNPYREHMLPDQLPLFDLMILIQNEYGHSARIGLFGISIIGNGQVVSINDMQTEITYTYTATDVDLLTYGGSSTENVSSIAIALDAYKERRDRINTGQSLHNSSFDVPQFWDVWDPEKRLMMSPQKYYKTVASITTNETYNKKTGVEQANKDLQVAKIYPPVEFFGDPSDQDAFIARIPPITEFPILIKKSFDRDAFHTDNSPIYTNITGYEYFQPLQSFETSDNINTNISNSKNANQLHTGSMYHSSTYTYIKNFYHGYPWIIHKVAIDLWKEQKVGTTNENAYFVFNIHSPYDPNGKDSPINEGVMLKGLDIYYGVGERKDFVLPYTEVQHEIPYSEFNLTDYNKGFKTYDMLTHFGKIKKIRISYYENPNGDGDMVGLPVEIDNLNEKLTESKKTNPVVSNSVLSLSETELNIKPIKGQGLVKSIKIEILDVLWPSNGPDALAIAAVIPKGQLLSMAKISLKEKKDPKSAASINITPTKAAENNCYAYETATNIGTKNTIRSANVFGQKSDVMTDTVSFNKRYRSIGNELINPLTGDPEFVCMGGGPYRVYKNKYKWTNSNTRDNTDTGYSSPSISVNMAIDDSANNQIQMINNSKYNNLILLKKLNLSNIITTNVVQRNSTSYTWPVSGNGVCITDSDKNNLSLHGYIGIIMYKNHPGFYKDNFFENIPTYTSIRRLSYIDFAKRINSLFGAKQPVIPVSKEADMLNANELFQSLTKLIALKSDDQLDTILEKTCVMIKKPYADLKTKADDIFSVDSFIFSNIIFNHLENITGVNIKLKFAADEYWITSGSEINVAGYTGAIDFNSSATDVIKTNNKQNMLHGIPIEDESNVSAYSSKIKIDCKTS